jgi:hypothetical protein
MLARGTVAVIKQLCDLSAVIPGRAEGANPESRKAKNPAVTEFRARSLPSAPE